RTVADGRNGTLWVADRADTEPAVRVFPAERELPADALQPTIDRDPCFAPDGVALWFVRQRLGAPPEILAAWRHRGAFLEPFRQPQLARLEARAPPALGRRLQRPRDPRLRRAPAALQERRLPRLSVVGGPV